jgi:hypothetical protein
MASDSRGEPLDHREDKVTAASLVRVGLLQLAPTIPYSLEKE